MLTSGLIADAEGARAVSMEHVRRAVGEEYWGLSSEDLMNLDEQGAAILTARSRPSSIGGRPTSP
jgi:Cdc6-like AAA superfamily ATPase